jgi:hypothetical protein
VKKYECTVCKKMEKSIKIFFFKKGNNVEFIINAKWDIMVNGKTQSMSL